jgi:hypothetical protein
VVVVVVVVVIAVADLALRVLAEDDSVYLRVGGGIL